MYELLVREMHGVVIYVITVDLQVKKGFLIVMIDKKVIKNCSVEILVSYHL